MGGDPHAPAASAVLCSAIPPPDGGGPAGASGAAPLHLEKLVEHRSAPYHGPRESGSGAGRPSAGPPLPREGG